MLLYIHAGHKLTASIMSPRQAAFFFLGGRALFPQLTFVSNAGGSDLVSTAGGSDLVSISAGGFYLEPTVTSGGVA
jgi:hypothetical protein